MSNWLTRSVFAVLLFCEGCSFALVSGPPARHREMDQFECTTSRLTPFLDTVWTAYFFFPFLIAVTSTEEQWNGRFQDGEEHLTHSAAIGVYAALAAVGASGMAFGYSRVERCVEAEIELSWRRSEAARPAPAAPSPPVSPEPDEPAVVPEKQPPQAAPPAPL